MYSLIPLAGLPGGWEWIVVLVIFLLLFGRRLPGVARSLGQGISSFKKGLNEPMDDVPESDSGSSESREPKSEKTEKSETTSKAD